MADRSGAPKTPFELEIIGEQKKMEAEQSSAIRGSKEKGIESKTIAETNAKYAGGYPVAGHNDPEHEHDHGADRGR